MLLVWIGIDCAILVLFCFFSSSFFLVGEEGKERVCVSVWEEQQARQGSGWNCYEFQQFSYFSKLSAPRRWSSPQRVVSMTMSTLKKYLHKKWLENEFFFFTCSWGLSWSTLLITCTQIVYCQSVEWRYVYKCTVCGRDIILTFIVKPIEAFTVYFYKYIVIINTVKFSLH